MLVGIAASTAMLVGVFGGSLIARELGLRHALDDLTPADRSFRVDLIGLPFEAPPARSDRVAHDALAGLTSGDPFGVTFFRDFWLDGEFVRLTALDEPERFVRLVSGRLPRDCSPSACEVLQIGNRGRPLLHEGDIKLVRVGIGELRDVAGLGPAFQRLRQERAQASIVESVPLIAPSTAALERLPALQLFFRVRGWVVPLESSAVHAWDIGRTLQKESVAQGTLQQSGAGYVLVGPDAAFLEARSRGAAYGERMVLVGGSAAALLLGFAMVAAIGLRRGLAAERRRLLRRGATRTQVWIALLAEVGAITAAGWLVGIVVGALAIAVLAAGLDVPVGGVLDHSLFEPQALAVIMVAWVLAAAVVVAVVATEGERAHGRRIRLLDVAALGAALAVVVGLARGSLGAEAAETRGDRAFLIVLPSLVCFVAAVAAARALGPLMAFAERASRRGRLALRLAFLALARAPSRTAAAGAYLVVAVGLVLFAASYQATLERGARDESGFAVPLDATLSEGSQLVMPLEAAPLDRVERLAPGVAAYPIVRRGADLIGLGSAVQSATVLGVPSRALAAMHWRSDFSSVPQASLARWLEKDASLRLEGPAIPANSETVALRAHLQGAPLGLDLVTRDAVGRIEVIRLGRATQGSSDLTARIPRERQGSAPRRLIGLQLYLPGRAKNWFLHVAHERRDVRAPAGSLRLGPLTISSPGTRALLTDWQGWITHGRASSVVSTGRIHYSFPEVQTIVVRPRQPVDSRRLNAIVSPLVADAAGSDGYVTLRLFDAPVRVRIVATATRFPTVSKDEQFVVVDGTGLSAVVDADAPGTATPLELWLSVPGRSDAAVMQDLRRLPFSDLDLASRRDLLEQRTRDPLARAIGYTLQVAALLALALAVIGVWVTLLGELRDERGDFFDLETQGLGPATLRWHLRLRTYALVVFGLVGGALLGVVLARLVVSLVQISVTAALPDPPLVFEPGWIPAVLAIAGLTIAAVVAAELSVRRAFRGDTPERASWSIE
ncbi:MAG: FtsX-like permease family protein [Gaiellaceae bacterium]